MHINSASYTVYNIYTSIKKTILIEEVSRDGRAKKYTNKSVGIIADKMHPYILHKWLKMAAHIQHVTNLVLQEYVQPETKILS